MSSQRIYLDYINDILDSILKVRSFLTDIDFDTFCSDVRTQYAVIRALEIIGEASRKIPANMREQYSDIPWKEMSGMRNKLIHDYFGVDTEVVWKTATEDIQPLEELFREMLSGLVK